MKSTMGIILTGGKNSRLKELSMHRSISAVPFGGKYRAIDFVISNMVNSGITNIGVLTQYNFRSLMDHLGSGKEWDLDRKNDGLFVFPPYLSESSGTGWYKGTSDAMYNNMSFLKRSDEEFVVIGQGYAVYSMDFEPMLKQHIDKDSDITIACRYMHDFKPEELSLFGNVKINSDNRITGFLEKPLNPKTKLSSMGIYIIKRKLLISLLEDSAAQGYNEFVRDILVKKVNELRLYAYIFSGYWRALSSLHLYYRANMELLNPEIRHELFVEKGPIFTKVKDEAPAKYNEEANVKNSIIADGCIIEGNVENSVLFRGVKIKKNATVKNSIIMQGSVINENASLIYSILDKNVVITRDKDLHGDPDWPLIVSKGVRV